MGWITLLALPFQHCLTIRNGGVMMFCKFVALIGFPKVVGFPKPLCWSLLLILERDLNTGIFLFLQNTSGGLLLHDLQKDTSRKRKT